MRRRFRAPIRRSGDGFVIDLGPEEAALVRRMIDELRQLLSDPGSSRSRTPTTTTPRPSTSG